MTQFFDPSLYGNAFSHGRHLRIGKDLFKFSVKRVGTLNLPTGRIVATDPFLNNSRAPFIQALLPGRYPVDLSIVRRNELDDERIAFARVLLTSRTPAVWIAAVTGRESVTAGENEPAGYRSGSGTGSYMDLETAKSFRLNSMKEVDEVLERMTLNFQPTRSWLDYGLDDRRNVIMFSSGEGPGTYPSYFAIDEEGDVAVLVTSFLAISS